MLVHNGRMLDDVLRRERMAPDDIMQAARQQGIDDLTDVRVVVLEGDGKLAFITDGSTEQQASGGDHSTST